jgi:FKBP-type peptidyl-prolyl cis-trans isomerase
MKLLLVKGLRWVALSAVFVALAGLSRCSSQNNEPAAKGENSNRGRSIEEQRSFVAKENESIKAYMKDRNYQLKRSGSGMYYKIWTDTVNQEPILPEDRVFYNYKVYHFNGSLLYTSTKSGTNSLVIDKQDAVIGLHQALKKMTLGDSGLFLLPSHLAYGVAGDQNKIPPLTALHYELEVVNIQKSEIKN